MKIKLDDYLLENEKNICLKIATCRTEEKIKDEQLGDERASYSYGQKRNKRTYEVELKHSYMGCLGECLTSKLTKSEWTKESGQYKGNKNPDLWILYNGIKTRGETRGTTSNNRFISRPQRDRYIDGNTLLFSITNLPHGPECNIGYISFKYLTELVDKHPEWKGSAPGSPYYEVPTTYLLDDFSVFGVN